MQSLICLGIIASLYGVIALLGFSISWVRERRTPRLK
jgi:hypothetical protein